MLPLAAVRNAAGSPEDNGVSVKSSGVLLPFLGLWVASCHHSNSADANTRDHLVSGYTNVLKSWDEDGDGKLSRSEVQTMVDASFRMMAQSARGGQAPHPQLETQLQEILAFYARQDTNHDGYLTLDELLKGPLANFDCMDENHDGKLSEEEVRSGFDRCPHINLSQYASKP